MMLFFLIGIFVLGLVIFMAWRMASRRFSFPCPSWLWWIVELENPLARSHHAVRIVERLDLEPGRRVLDAGCGPGRVTIPLARAVGPDGEVTAIDIQPRMLQRAEGRAKKGGLSNIRFQKVGLGEGKVGEALYDRAVLVTVLGEIPDRKQALHELYRALKPGGILSVTEMVFDPHYQSRKTVRRIAESVGFQEKAFWGNRWAYTMHLQKPAPS